jgi:hypothetical protein
MKRVIAIFWVAFALLVLQACSGIKVSQDYEQGYDFSKLKTYTWKPNDDKEYGIVDNDLMDRRVRTAIENTLSARQYKQVFSGNPDFYISYHLTIEQIIHSSNVGGGFSVGRSSGGRYGSIGVGTGTRVQTYDQGTLLIDITDGSSNKLIWRGTSTQSVSEHSDPEKITQSVNETVEKTLLQFPPQ